MKRFRLFLRKAASFLFRAAAEPPPDQRQTIRRMNDALIDLARQADAGRHRYMEQVAELIEARAMAGAGPWQASPEALRETDRLIAHAHENYGRVRESGAPLSPQGAFGDIELALQNVEWRRAVNMSWLEFSRWGIQQIILISRLNYVKNPIIRRLIDVCAAYVFARGVEVTSSNEAANAVLQDFFARNQATLGQNALADLERRKDYDGNLYFVLFADTQNTGLVNCRTIDATEIQEIVCDPEDSDKPRYYKRIWSQKVFDEATGNYSYKSLQRWYPALGYEPAARVIMIGEIEVAWDSPIYHRKCGGVSKWLFGCPRIYPALDWAKEARRYLEHCASVAAALSQIAWEITTKGGQQALEGIKQQWGTTVGPDAPLWDTNPMATQGSTFASGPGTKLSAMLTRGKGADPEEVRQYKLMCCMVAGVPETFLADVSTGNLATATSLDRPTETGFLEKQEAWREDLVIIAGFVLKVSLGAASGKLRESIQMKKDSTGTWVIRECASKFDPNGRRVYEAFSKEANVVELRCNFPAIREGDIPQLVSATVAAMMPGTGEGIDPKAGVQKLYDLLGVENGEELSEQQYPEDTYDPDRTKEPAEPDDPTGADVRKTIKEAARAVRNAQLTH